MKPSIYPVTAGLIVYLGLLADAAQRGKPVIIPESAPDTRDLEDPAVWEQWFVPYFELVRGDPNIKGFCYSNRNFVKNDVTLADWGNLRIDESQALAPLYQEELSRPVYQHRIDPVPALRSAPLREAARDLRADITIEGAGHNDIYGHGEFADAARASVAAVMRE